MEKYFSRITQTQALLIGLLFAGLYFMMVFDDGSTLQTQKDQVDAEIRQIDIDVANMKKAIEQAQAYEVLAKQKGQKFLEWTKFLPRDFERKDQMKLIATEARQAAMEPSLSEGQGGVTKKLEFYEEQEVDANIKGTFIKLMVFLSNLTKSERVLGVRSLSLQADTSRNFADGSQTVPPSLSIQIKFIGYKYTGSPTEEKKEP